MARTAEDGGLFQIIPTTQTDASALGGAFEPVAEYRVSRPGPMPILIEQPAPTPGVDPVPTVPYNPVPLPAPIPVPTLGIPTPGAPAGSGGTGTAPTASAPPGATVSPSGDLYDATVTMSRGVAVAGAEEDKAERIGFLVVAAVVALYLLTRKRGKA